jgi:hypothetical protein
MEATANDLWANVGVMTISLVVLIPHRRRQPGAAMNGGPATAGLARGVHAASMSLLRTAPPRFDTVRPPAIGRPNPLLSHSEGWVKPRSHQDPASAGCYGADGFETVETV